MNDYHWEIAEWPQSWTNEDVSGFCGTRMFEFCGSDGRIAISSTDYMRQFQTYLVVSVQHIANTTLVGGTNFEQKR